MQETQSHLPVPLPEPPVNALQRSPTFGTSSLSGTGSSYLSGEEQRLRRKLAQAGQEKYEVE